jgi:type IV secretory pathway TraG/TraD family ATPase VirD4
VVYGIAAMLDQKKVVNRSAYAAFASFLQLPEQATRPSVLGTVQSHLRLFDSDLTRRLTDSTTMDIDGFCRAVLKKAARHTRDRSGALYGIRNRRVTSVMAC